MIPIINGILLLFILTIVVMIVKYKRRSDRVFNDINAIHGKSIEALKDHIVLNAFYRNRYEYLEMAICQLKDELEKYPDLADIIQNCEDRLRSCDEAFSAFSKSTNN